MLYTWSKTRLEVGSIICACNPEEISLLLFVIQSSIPVLLYYLLFTIPDVHRILSNKVLLVIIYTILGHSFNAFINFEVHQWVN